MAPDDPLSVTRRAPRDQRRKRWGGLASRFEGQDVAAPERPEALLALDEALDRLATPSPQASELEKLRFFVGCSNAEAASSLGISPRKTDQVWAYAHAWLRKELGDDCRGLEDEPRSRAK
jgi:DNA-directed RNA polymerase specialized sigma24 family protein